MRKWWNTKIIMHFSKMSSHCYDEWSEPSTRNWSCPQFIYLCSVDTWVISATQEEVWAPQSVMERVTPLSSRPQSCCLLFHKKHHCICLKVLILINHNIQPPPSIERYRGKNRSCKSLLFLLFRELSINLNSVVLSCSDSTNVFIITLIATLDWTLLYPGV